MLIRPSKRSDAHSIARVYVITWQDTYLSVLPYAYLTTMSIPQHAQAFLNELKNNHVVSFIAEDRGRVVGFITGGYERNGDCIYSGEIYTLYVLKNHQRQGIGLKLVTTLAKQLNKFGIYSMLVQVLKQNPYRHFYKKINGIYLKTQRLPFAGETLDVEFYGWIDTTLVYPSSDFNVSSTFAG